MQQPTLIVTLSPDGEKVLIETKACDVGTALHLACRAQAFLAAQPVKAAPAVVPATAEALPLLGRRNGRG